MTHMLESIVLRTTNKLSYWSCAGLLGASLIVASVLIKTTSNTAVALPPSPTPAEETANTEYQSARKLYKAHDYKAAIPAFKKFIAEHKDSDSKNIAFQVLCAINYGGFSAYKSQDYVTAQDMFNQAIAETKGNDHPAWAAQSATARHFLTLTLKALGKTEDAIPVHLGIIQDFKGYKYPRFDGYALESMLELGDYYRATHHANKAIPYYQEARDHSLENRSRIASTVQYMAQYGLAYAYLESDQNTKAKIAFKKFITTYAESDQKFIQERITNAKAELSRL